MTGDETSPQKYTHFTPERRTKFLELLRKRPNVTAAAEAVEVSKKTAYDAYHRDPDFAAAWNEAINGAMDDAEEELYRRGVEGWLEPVFYQGQEVGTVRKFSDTCLARFLQAHRPNKYADKHIHRLAEEDPVNEALRAIDGTTLGPPSEREGAYLPPAEGEVLEHEASQGGEEESEEEHGEEK